MAIGCHALHPSILHHSWMSACHHLSISSLVELSLRVHAGKLLLLLSCLRLLRLLLASLVRLLLLL